MNRGRQIVIGGLGLLLAGAAIGEDVFRRRAEHRYSDATQAKRQLEQHVEKILSAHEQLTSDLQREQQRSNELSDALVSTRGELEQAVGRLAEEAKRIQQLTVRLAAMQGHMDQLQGELAMTLQERPREPAGESGPVQLERVVVSHADASELKGRIISVHQDWNFVVIDLGWDAVKIGDTVSIFRNEQLLAKARIERVQEAVCAATILPEWNAAAVQVNDVARVL